jgi:hypothetical protein
MADFVDAGGSTCVVVCRVLCRVCRADGGVLCAGVVLLAFATCNMGESPGGRWAKDNYFPIALDGQTSLHVELGPESEGRDHHLLTGVRRAFVSYHGTSVLLCASCLCVSSVVGRRSSVVSDSVCGEQEWDKRTRRRR